jgi:hypothetical protein
MNGFACRERHTTQIRALLTAVASFRSGQASRLVPTRANGQPAYGMYRVDPASGLAHGASITGRRSTSERSVR